MVAGVPDHLPVEHDRVRAPLPEALVAAHLAEPEREEAHDAVTRKVVGQVDVELLRRPLTIAVEDRLEKLRRHR